MNFLRLRRSRTVFIINAINPEFKFWMSRVDYKDEILPVQFAYNDDYFLVYDDDFRWYYDKNSVCLFPARRIFKLEKGNKVSQLWSNGIDLFGIACD